MNMNIWNKINSGNTKLIGNFYAANLLQSKSVKNYITKVFSSSSTKQETLSALVKKISKEQNKPSLIYQSLVEKQHLTNDENQLKVIQLLDELQVRLNSYQPNSVGTSSLFRKLFSSEIKSPKGLYLYGNVGTGKTLLMDLFYMSSDVKKKKRIHFHQFMLDVHARIHRQKATIQPKSDRKVKPYDPIAPVADEISEETWLLCFDEFQVTDIADAMILRRLFSRLFENGIVMFATSNRPPNDLYKGGLQRSNFVPFIGELKEHCHDYSIDSLTDYRLLGMPSEMKSYWMSTENDTNVNLDKLFMHYARHFDPTSVNIDSSSKTLRILGRDLHVPKCYDKIADFSFDNLCMQALGAIDYIELAKKFRIIILRDVPQLNIYRKREARRLITLIDTFYDAKVGLIISGEVNDPVNLFVQATQDEKRAVMLANSIILDDLAIKQEDDSIDFNVFSGEEEEFAFKRAVSRLKEMQTDDYWKECLES